MKRTLLILTIVAGVLALAPGAKADHWEDDFRADVHSLWDWQHHLMDEANHRGDRHIRDELEGTRAGLEDVDHQLDHHHWKNDHVRAQLDGLRDQLRHISDELHWHGEVHHRPGFTIEFR